MATIQISAGSDGSFSVENSLNYQAAELSEAEAGAAKIILEALSSAGPLDVTLERKSKDYISLVSRGVYDFARLKVGKKSSWFSVALSPEDRSRFSDDPRFSSAKKSLLHWKVPFSLPSELEGDGDLFLLAYAWAQRQ